MIFLYLYGMRGFHFMISIFFSWLQASMRNYRDILLFLVVNFVLICISAKFVVYHTFAFGDLSILELFYTSLTFAVMPTSTGYFLGVIYSVINKRI